MLMALHMQVKNPRILAFALVMFFAAMDVTGQQKMPDVSISISEENIRLDELLTRIAQQTGLAFSYNPKRIPVQQRIDFRVTNESLGAVLDKLTSEFGLVYEFIENQIILKPDKRSGKVAARTFTISGTIKDSNSGEALIGASVYLHELQTGTVANSFGFYSITIPAGTYTITISFIGYKYVTRVVELSQSLRLDLFLTADSPLLQEVVVTSSPSITGAIGTSSTNIDPSSVEDRPEFFGEMDVIKSLESVPGVKFHSDGSTFYYVRGGYRDQNLILIDDAPVYNPSHMLGIFSTVIPDAVNDVTFYKGYRPPSLGGRLSSVLDVRTKKGNNRHFQAWGNVGLISTKVGIEGPIRKNASSYLLSGRFSSLRWLFKRTSETIDDFNFHDLTGKINVRFNESNRAFFSFYSGADNYFAGNSGISWSNNAAAVQWNHLFSDRLFLNTTIAGGGYDYFLYVNVQNDTKWNSHISNFNLKTDFSYFIRPGNELTFGTGINGYAFNPGNLQSQANVSLPALSVRNSLEFVLYANHEVKMSRRIGLSYGVRLTSWSNRGEAFEYIFDENRMPVDTLYFGSGESYKRFVSAEPRLAVSFFVNDESSLKASFSRNIQNIHLISNSISPFTSLDVWLPSSFNIKPQSANEVTVGYYRNLSRRAVNLSVEAYYKRMSNQIDYDAHAQILLNPLLEGELRFGRATAYGLEMMVKKDEGHLHGSASYTWSKATRRFADINEGREYDAYHDRPHQVTFTGLYDLSTRWRLGANWSYLTGSPYSSPVSFFSFNGEEVPVYGPRNNARLPDYHRLDLSATYRLNRNPESKFAHDISFSVYNLYGRRNALFVNYNKTVSGDGSLKIPADVTDPHRITSQYYLFGLTPSVSYNFKWL